MSTKKDLQAVMGKTGLSWEDIPVEYRPGYTPKSQAELDKIVNEARRYVFAQGGQEYISKQVANLSRTEIAYIQQKLTGR